MLNAEKCEEKMRYWQARLENAKLKEGKTKKPENPTENAENPEKMETTMENAEIEEIEETIPEYEPEPIKIPKQRKIKEYTPQYVETDSCPYCGTEIYIGTNVCPQCGNQIGWEELSDLPEWCVCPYCGYAIPIDHYMGQPCPRCHRGGI